MLWTEKILLSSQQECFLLLVHCALWQAGQNTLGYTFLRKPREGIYLKGLKKEMSTRFAFTFQQPKYLLT